MLRGEIGQLVERMLAHGASSTQITQIITLLNDHTVCRVIELALAERGDPGVPFSWLCFGSEGRREQTLHTDQTTAFSSKPMTPPRPRRFAPDCCHLPSTSISAWPSAAPPCAKAMSWPAIPSCASSRSEWARRFAGFIREASPENLLGSSIYFDLRVVWGDEQGCEQLRRGILEQVADNRIFQRMMADNALRQRPPVGRLREFVLTRQGNDKAATLDLKVRGLTPSSMAHAAGAGQWHQGLQYPGTSAPPGSPGHHRATGWRRLRGGLPLHPADPHAAAPAPKP